jgi:general secretion pathway protein E
VAGPRSGGVTTTLYSTLNDLDPIRLNICTFEDGINFSLPGVNQFSPATCGTVDAASALRRLLQQQVDVLALDGEMPDTVARLAVEAAMDGCLVLAHVRAGDAADAIAKMLAVAPPEDLATVLQGVLAQRLVRTICPHCRTTYDPPAHLRRRISEIFGPVEQYASGRGCANCGRTGLLGQMGLFELVPVQGALADRIRARAGREALRDAIRAAGFPSLWVDGINKVRAGITSLEEVTSVLAGCPGEVPTMTPPIAADH